MEKISIRTTQKEGFRRDRGTALIEASLLLPILVLLCVGVFEFGRILMIQESLTNAAREGARAAAIKLDNAQALSSAQTVSQNYLIQSGVDTSKVTIDPIFSQVDGQEAIQITIRFNYTSTLYGWIPGIPQALDLRSRAVMRREA